MFKLKTLALFAAFALPVYAQAVTPTPNKADLFVVSASVSRVPQATDGADIGTVEKFCAAENTPLFENVFVTKKGAPVEWEANAYAPNMSERINAGKDLLPGNENYEETFRFRGRTVDVGNMVFMEYTARFHGVTEVRYRNTENGVVMSALEYFRADVTDTKAVEQGRPWFFPLDTEKAGKVVVALRIQPFGSPLKHICAN